MENGTQVLTEHGEGIIVGKDLPLSPRVTRLVVKITNPKNEHAEMVGRFKNNELCYFNDEVSIIKK